MRTEAYKTEIRLVFPSEMRVDETYQRDTRESHVKRIIGEFNINKVNMPKVSLRDDGKFYIMDGAHTMAVWKIKFGNKPIMCIVYHDLTWAEEAEIFLAQRGTTIAVTQKEKLNTRYNMEDEDVIAMALITDSIGFKINFHTPSHSKYRINATDALYSVYKDCGRELFTDVLDTIFQAWDGEIASLSSGFLKGIGKFYKLYNGKFKKQELINDLKSMPPSHFTREAKNYVTGKNATKYCRAFLKCYNAKRRNRLPDIFE